MKIISLKDVVNLILGGIIGFGISYWFWDKECESKIRQRHLLDYKEIGFYYLHQKRPTDAAKFANDILLLDKSNGHGLYLLCEGLVEQDLRASNDACEEYLKNWPLITAKERGQNKVKGYFDQRTAWIALSLADRYSKQAKMSKDKGLAKKACEKLLLSESNWQHEFKGPISNSQVRRRIEEILGSKCE